MMSPQLTVTLTCSQETQDKSMPADAVPDSARSGMRGLTPLQSEFNSWRRFSASDQVEWVRPS